MTLDWEIDEEIRLPYGLLDASTFVLTADCCAVTEHLPLPSAIHVFITDDKHIRTINQNQRGVDSATDVLSFPTITYASGHTAHTSAHALRREYDTDLNACFLGDIIISWEHAVEQAAQYGHSVKREFCYLVAHGIFHLCGYDHMLPEEQKEMRGMEEKALDLAGVTRDGDRLELPTDEQLLLLAHEAMQRSYSPYSHFRVGACLLAADGRVFEGCNVENASYGLTNCAERTAVFKAVSEGAREFTAIAIAADRAAPWPCGACRQVLNEFAPNIRVLVTWNDGKEVDQAQLQTLLPHGFGPKELS